MTTQPELPDVALDGAGVLARPLLRLATAPAAPDLDFDAFVRAYEIRLRRLVLRRIGDLSEAEEITQETLLRAYQHRASFVSEDELMAWSTVVAQRLVIDRVRVRGRSIAVADVPENARLGRDTAEIVVARHEARAALESLEAIPNRQAAILWAREVEGLHYEEIAERFGISEPAVRSLLHRGRKALRKEFKDRTGSIPLGGLTPFAPWLLALKAAGRVRGAAKAVTRSAGLSAVALSVTALVVAGGVAGVVGGHRAGSPTERISTARGGATHVSQVATEGSGAELAASEVRRGGGGKGSTTGTPDWFFVPPGLRRTTCDSKGATPCVKAKKFPYSDTVIEIEVPVVEQGLVVTTDLVTCEQAHLPDGGPVRCSQHPTNDPNGPSVPPLPQLPPSSTPSEGATR